MNDWCVITAGPSSGKSSVIRELGSRGYRTAPEAARIVFDQAISEGISPEEKREEPGFRQEIEQIDQRILHCTPSREMAFFDRCIADNIVYRRREGTADEEKINELRRHALHFDKVFMLDQLEFTDDHVRSESPEEAREIHEELYKEYKTIGFDVIEIPVAPVDERVDMMLDELDCRKV